MDAIKEAMIRADANEEDAEFVRAALQEDIASLEVENERLWTALNRIQLLGETHGDVLVAIAKEALK